MSRSRFRTMALATVSSALLAGTALPAWAGAFGLREQGAAGQGMSFAGVAAGSGGLSSMYWNPATVTMNPGFQTYNSVSVIDLDGKITPLPGTSPLLGNLPSGGIGETAAVPSSYTSYQLNESWWVGLSGNAPYGLVTKPNFGWTGQIYARTSRIYTVNFNPILGWKVNDWLSLGVGPTIEYFTVKLKRATSPFSPFAPSAELRGDDVGFGVTAGATITPFAGTTIGIGYRSTIEHDLQGRITTPTANTQIKSKLNTPELLTVGITQVITPDFRLNAGYEFTNWSRLGFVSQTALSGPASGFTVNALPLRYKDGHFVSFGGEYDWSPQWTFRAGGAYEWSPITDSVRSPTIPDANRIWASLGATYRWTDKISIDLAYSHIFADKAPIRIVPGNPALVSAGPIPLSFVAEGKAQVDIFTAALRYRWDDTRVAQAAPIVRKY